jgi:alkylation response protein AidB-like acyl-CoA dehydrogenase
MSDSLNTEAPVKLDAALAALPALASAIGEDAAQREARRELPFDRFALFRQSGLGVLRFPVEWGGLGGSLEDLIHVITTLAAEESNVAHALRIHFDLTEQLLLSPRSAFNDTQIERVREGAIFGGASTERGTSRPGEIVTKLVRDGDHFRVSGKKYYSTGTAFSDYARINVQDENDEKVSIVIPVSREGLTVLDDWDGMGQRMTASGSLVLDNVQVFVLPGVMAVRCVSCIWSRWLPASCAIFSRMHGATWSITAARCCIARRRRPARTVSCSRWWAISPPTAFRSTHWCSRMRARSIALRKRFAMVLPTPKNWCWKARSPAYNASLLTTSCVLAVASVCSKWAVHRPRRVPTISIAIGAICAPFSAITRCCIRPG